MLNNDLGFSRQERRHQRAAQHRTFKGHVDSIQNGADPDQLYRMDFRVTVTQSTLADANRSRIYHDLAQTLIARRVAFKLGGQNPASFCSAR